MCPGESDGAPTGPFAVFAGTQMLRLDAVPADAGPARHYYVTPFVTDGERLYVFEEPGDRSDALEELLLGSRVSVSSRSTGETVVVGVGRRPTAAQQAWARDACAARFHYDQALQDMAQLGSVVAVCPAAVCSAAACSAA